MDPVVPKPVHFAAIVPSQVGEAPAFETADMPISKRPATRGVITTVALVKTMQLGAIYLAVSVGVHFAVMPAFHYLRRGGYAKEHSKDQPKEQYLFHGRCFFVSVNVLNETGGWLQSLRP